MQLQRSAEENLKTFPACWRANTTDLKGIEGDGKDSDSSARSAGSSATEGQRASEQLSLKGINASSDALPESAANCSTCCESPLPNKTVTASRVTVNETKTNNNPSASSRKLNLEDYKRRLSNPSITAVDCSGSKSTAVANKQGSHGSLPRCSKSVPEVVNSSLKVSTTNTPGVKPRIKLKIGPQVVVSTVISPQRAGSDVCRADVMQNILTNGTCSSGQCAADVPFASVNGDASEESNLVLFSPSAVRAGHASSSSSFGCEDESSNSQPPSKRARMSFNRQLSAADWSSRRDSPQFGRHQQLQSC